MPTVGDRLGSRTVANRIFLSEESGPLSLYLYLHVPASTRIFLSEESGPLFEGKLHVPAFTYTCIYIYLNLHVPASTGPLFEGKLYGRCGHEEKVRALGF